MATTQAIVTVGEVTMDAGDSGSFFSSNSAIKDDGDSDASIFTDYQIKNRYVKNKRTYMLGITSPDGFEGDNAAFVRLSEPTLLWICDWTACRFNTAPDIPDPESKDPRWVLMDEEYEPVMIIVGPDGSTPLYRISGTYIYGCKRSNVKTIRDVSYPLAPWLEDVFTRTMPENKLKAGLSESNNSSSAGSSLNFALPN